MFFSVLGAAAESTGIFVQFEKLMARGGPLMWPILICSIVGFAATLNRCFFFINYRILVRMGNAAFEKMLTLVREGKTEEAIKQAEGVPSPQVVIFKAGLQAEDGGFADAVQHEALGQIQLMNRKSILLSTVVTVSPMFGILGTVTGIITSFDLLGSMGVEDPTAVTGGIAEALLTTAAGLTVSICALLPLNYFSALTRRNIRELEEFTHRMELAVTHQKPRAKGGK